MVEGDLAWLIRHHEPGDWPLGPEPWAWARAAAEAPKPWRKLLVLTKHKAALLHAAGAWARRAVTAVRGAFHRAGAVDGE
eukprot:9082183-Lingulodinium_polyedra.AAC.1